MILKTFAAVLLCCALSCSGQSSNDTANWGAISTYLSNQTSRNDADDTAFDAILRANANARSTLTGRSANDADFLFQGDIDMPFAEVQALLKNTGATGRKKRAVMRKGRYNRLWPRNIAYEISSDLSWTARASIQRAIKTYEYVLPCMGKWQPRTRRTRNYMSFFRGGGCYSQVGYKGGAQRVSIGNGCQQDGIVIHEIGHALGLWHEQSRPDRDNYVTIHTQNIMPGMAYNFNKLPQSRVNSLGEPYDYGSVMHYGSTAFSSNRQPTISRRRGSGQLGQRRGLSASDQRQLKALYCPGTKPTKKPTVECKDKNINCASWRSRYCTHRSYVKYMTANCAKSCGKCVVVPVVPVVPCIDKSIHCAAWKRKHYCTHQYITYMTANCRKSCGKCR